MIVSVLKEMYMKRTFVITMILSILVSGIPIGALANGDHDVPPKEAGLPRSPASEISIIGIYSDLFY